MNEQKQETAGQALSAATDTEATATSLVDAAGTADPGTTAGMDEDVLLPDGWTGTEFPVTDDDPLGMGPASDTPASAGTDGEMDGGKEATAEKNEPETDTEDSPETTEKPADKEELSADDEPDYKALWLAHQEEQNAAHFRQVYQAQKDAGMTDEAARLIAASECGGKSYPVDGPAAGNSGTSETGQDSGIDAQLRRLHTILPDARDIPRAVMKRVQAGENLVDAYLSNALSERDATIDAQKREIATLRQNAANREKAVASGVSGQGMKSEAPDEFMRGFLSED